MSRFTAPIRKEPSSRAVTDLPSHSRRICPPSAESSKAGIFEAGGFTEYDLSNLSGSSVEFFRPARAGGEYLKLTASLSAGRSSRPRPPAHPFLLEEKDAKDHSGGVCGLPLKTPGGSHRSQRYIRYEPRVRVSAGWYALTVPGAAQRCGTSFQRLV